MRAFQFQLNDMTKTFTYTERILEGLNGTIMNLNVPNKLDTGLSNSATAQNAINNGNGWVKKVLGQTSDPGKIDDLVSKYKADNSWAKFYNAIKGKPVNLLEILYLEGQQPVEEAVNIPSANYVFMFESNGMYSLGGVYYQMFGDSQAVCIDYKGAKATIVGDNKYGDFLHNSASFKFQEASQYIQKNGDSIIDKAKQHALSMFTGQNDRAVINNFISGGPAPGIIYDSIAMGIIDTANIPRKSLRAITTTAKYIVAPFLYNKDLYLYNQNKVAGTLNEFNPLPKPVKSDVDAKLNEIISDTNPYGSDMANLNMAMDIQRRNPIKTYCTIVKGCEAAVNWMVGDLSNVTGTTVAGQEALFFSSPSIDQVYRVLGTNAKPKPGYQIAVVRAFANYNNFPLQIRAFTSEYDYTNKSYKASIKADKLIVVFPGFNNYVREKAKSMGLSGGDGYIKVIQELPLSENSSFRAAGIDIDIFYKTLSRLYTDSGFKDGVLFKFLPTLFGQTFDKNYDIYTSMEDFSDVELDYLSNLSLTDRTSDATLGFPKRLNVAANLLFDPMDEKEPTRFNQYTAGLSKYNTEKSMAAQNNIYRKGRFMSLYEITHLLADRLEYVKTHDDLMSVGNELAQVLRNLANGFWTLRGEDGVETAKKLVGPAPNNYQMLGFYNILGTGDSKLGDISVPLLDLKSIENYEMFHDRRNEGIKEAESKFAGKVKPAQTKRS